MKSLFRAFAAPALGAALLGSALPLSAQGTASYFTSFESAEGYALGAFDGYPTWGWEGGLFANVAAPGFDGDQRLEVHGTGRLDYVPVVAFGPGAVWLDLMVRPALGDLADLPALAPGRSALSGFVQVGSTGEVYVFDGDSTAAGSGRWRASGVRLVRGTDGAFIPLRLTYRVDYAARRWDLFVDDRLVWADLGFADGSVPAFGRFSIRADSSASTGLDFFYVGEENPLFVDAGDGIPAAWWSAHGLNAASAGGRHGDADADGLSNLAEYLLGLDPSDPDSNHDGLPDGIATVDANFRSVVVGAASLLATADDGLAWRASFSTPEGYVAGPLNGQQSWRGLRAEVTSEAEVHLGSSAVPGAPTSTSALPSEIEQRFNPSTASALWITFRAKLQAGPLPEIQADRQPFAALFGFAGSRALTVRDGEAWVPHFVTENAADWNTYVLHLDYATGRWLLALNGRLVARDLAFNDATRQTLGAFRALQTGVDGAAWIDDIAITEREPAGLDFDQDGLDGRDETARGTDPFLADTDGDQLPDGWEVAQSFDPRSAADAAQDADGDSLSNLVEYQLGTAPRVANDRVAGALVAQRWKTLSGNEISTLTDSSRFPLQPTGSFLLSALTLPYNFDRDYGIRIRGYLLAPVDGDYLFWVSGDFQSQLWLSPTDSPFDRQRIAYVESGVGQGNYDTLPSQRSAVIKLRAGQAYYFEVLQKGGVSYDHLNVAWRTPNGTREVIPAARVASFARRADDLDDDGLPDVWETQYGLSVAQGHALHGAYGDFDGDRLSNLEEYQVGTDPSSPDTDGDGISDYEAVRLLGVDPTAGLFDGDAVTVVSTPGSGGVSVNGDWEAVDGGMEARVLRGSIAYDVALSSAGIFRLDLVVRDAYEANPFRHFDVEVKVDGLTVGRLDIYASGAETGLGQLYLPWLEAGAHRIELVWHNGRPQSFLRVESLALVNPSTLDADADGVADWMESRLDQTFSVDAETVQTAISPFTLEGGSLYPQFLSATARYKRNGRAAERLFAAFGSTVTADAPRGQLLRQIAAESVASDTEESDPTAVDLTVEAGLARRFFAHVPLDPEAPVRVRVREGAGVRTVTKKLVWKPLNLLALEAGSELQLRDFDRLLISAQKLAGGQGNSAPVALTLIRPDESEELYSLKRQDVLELGFDQAGVYQFWIQPKNEPERLALTVEVFRIELDPAPITIANALREWSPSALPEVAVVQADSTVLFDEKLPVQSPRRFVLSAPAVGGSLVARLGGESGPLADALRLKPIVSYHGEISTWDIVQIFSDGTELWKGVIDLGGPVPPGLSITMRVIVGGALFDDGSLVRTLTAADFDANGVYTYYLLLAPEARGSVCHEVRFFEGGDYLGLAY